MISRKLKFAAIILCCLTQSPEEADARINGEEIRVRVNKYGQLIECIVRLQSDDEIHHVFLSELVANPMDPLMNIDDLGYVLGDPELVKVHMDLKCFALGVHQHRNFGMDNNHYPEFFSDATQITDPKDLVEIIKSQRVIEVRKTDVQDMIRVSLERGVMPADYFHDVGIPLTSLSVVDFCRTVEDCFETIRGPREIRYYVLKGQERRLVAMETDEDLRNAIAAVRAGAKMYARSDD